MNAASKHPWTAGVLPDGRHYLRCAEGKDVAYFPDHTNLVSRNPLVVNNRRDGNILFVAEASRVLDETGMTPGQQQTRIAQLEAWQDDVRSNSPLLARLERAEQSVQQLADALSLILKTESLPLFHLQKARSALAACKTV